MDEKERYEQGMQKRRQVLGDAHVDKAQANRTDFNADFQDLITRYAWGEVWTRPGLPSHTRSLMTICMMVALNREEELKLHLWKNWQLNRETWMISSVAWHFRCRYGML